MSFHICILFIAEVFQQLFLFARSRILKTAWKHRAVLQKENTIIPHGYTHDFQRMRWMGSQRGKRVCQAKYRLTAHYEGFPKTAMWSWMYGGGGAGMEKWGKWLCVLILRGKRTRWAKRFPINVNEGLSQKDFFFPPFSLKQEVRC